MSQCEFWTKIGSGLLGLKQAYQSKEIWLEKFVLFNPPCRCDRQVQAGSRR